MKRKTLDVQRAVYEEIKRSPGITMSQLEHKIGTNPASLKEHCHALQHLKLIKIKQEKRTRRLQVW